MRIFLGLRTLTEPKLKISIKGWSYPTYRVMQTEKDRGEGFKIHMHASFSVLSESDVCFESPIFIGLGFTGQGIHASFFPTVDLRLSMPVLNSRVAKDPHPFYSQVQIGALRCSIQSALTGC